MRGLARPGMIVLAVAVPLLAGACGGSSSTAVVGPSDVRCTVTVAPDEATVSAARAHGSITVTAERECAWSAAADAEWIAITAGARGQGEGRIEYVVQENPIPAARLGAVVVGEQRVEIAQDAAPCRFTLSASGQTIGAPGGELRVDVAAFDGCAWNAASHVAWIVVTGGQSGAGRGTVALQVAANGGAPRSGQVAIADQLFTITQEAACTFDLSHPASHLPAGGGTPTVDVLTQPWCAWQAASQVPWIGIAGPDRGVGSGTVTLAVAGNGGPPRTGGVTIAGHLHTVTQDAAPCGYAIEPLSQRVPFAGGTFTVTVLTQPWCAWSAVSHDSWITVIGGANGLGSGTVTYQVNSRGLLPLPRTGTLTIAGHTFPVTQTLILGDDAGTN